MNFPTFLDQWPAFITRPGGSGGGGGGPVPLHAETHQLGQPDEVLLAIDQIFNLQHELDQGIIHTNDVEAAAEKLSNKDIPDGYAGLDASSKLAGTQQRYGTTANTACEGNDPRLKPAGASGQVQFNDAGAFGGDTGVSFDKNTDLLSFGSGNILNGQLRFPSTQNPSSDPDILDDYRERTWTPTTAVALTVTSAVYVKIGRFVIASMDVAFASNSNAAQATIAGLPGGSSVSAFGGFLSYQSSSIGAFAFNIQGANAYPYLLTAGAAPVTCQNLSGATVRAVFLYMAPN